jgi:hypothetical protein
VKRGPNTTEGRAAIGAAQRRRAERDRLLREKAALVFASCSDEQLRAAGLESMRREDGTRVIAVGDLALIEVQAG